jgi:hypothetical protein
MGDIVMFAIPKLFSLNSLQTIFLVSMIVLLSACGGSGGSNKEEPAATVTLQDGDAVLANTGIDSLDALKARVAEKGALAFSIELTKANPELQSEAIVRLLKQNNRNIEYQKLVNKGIEKPLVDRLKQLRMTPQAVKNLVQLPDQSLFPQQLTRQAIDLFNQEKLQQLNAKLRLRGQEAIDLAQFESLQSAFEGMEMVDNFGPLNGAFQNILIEDSSANRAGTAGKAGGLVLANQELYSKQPELDSGLPAADSCFIMHAELPLQIATAGASVNSSLVSAENGNAVVKVPESGIALFAISSTATAHVSLSNSNNTVLVDQDVVDTWYIHLPISRADICQPFTFAGADSAYEIKLIDLIKPERLSQQVYYDGDNYLSNAEKVELLNEHAFFNAKSYSFASFNSTLTEINTLFEMQHGIADSGATGFDLLIHSPSGNLYVATQTGIEGYQQATGFSSAIPRESGVWRIDLLPPSSVTVGSNQISSITAKPASTGNSSLKVMTLVSADSQQIQSREFMLGVVKNISLKTQGDDGVFNEGEVSVTLNTTMAPKLNVPDYIDDLLASGDKMNDKVALWHCWVNSEKTGHEFEVGESCYEYYDEYQDQLHIFTTANSRYDPQRDPQFYQCAPGEEAHTIINGYDYCIRGWYQPWGIANPSEVFKVQKVMNDYSRHIRDHYANANYLHILSNYYDLYQNWQTRTVLADTSTFPYDGLAYKTNEYLPCAGNEEGCSFFGLTLPAFPAPVVIETNRPVFGVPVDRVNETTLPITIDYTVSDDDEYNEDAELWTVLAYAATQVYNISQGNFLGMVCDSIGLVDDLHELEMDAEDDPLGSARAIINRYSSNDPFYGLHNARSYSFFISGQPEQNNEVDTYGQKLNYAQIACAATQLSVSGINFTRNADHLLSLDAEQLFDNASLETTIREAAALAGSVSMAADAVEIARLIQEGDIDAARERLKVNSNINNLSTGTDVYSDLASLIDTFSNEGSAENGNNVLKSNAHYLLGSGKKTRAELEFERISSLPVDKVTVKLDTIHIIYNYESSSNSDGAEIEISPFVGLIDDRERYGLNTHALFSQTSYSSGSNGAWNRLRFNHVEDGDVISPDTTIFNSELSSNAAALYIEVSVIEDDGNSVEDDDMIGVFSQTIKLEEIFNKDAKFKWQHISGNDYQLLITDYPIYNSNNQLSLENPLSDSYQLQRAHNQNRLPAALVNLTINITLGDLTTAYPVVDTGLEVAEVNAGKDTYSMEMNEVNRIELQGISTSLKLDDVFAGKALVYKNGIPIDGTLYSYDVESAELKELFTYDVDSFTGDLLPIKQATFAQKNIGRIVDYHSTPEAKRLSMVKLLSGNRLLFVFSADTGAKIMVVSYTDQGVMTLESTTEVVDELSSPVYTLMVARLSPDRSGLLLPYLDENYRGSDRTLAPHPSIMYYQIDGNNVVYKNTLVGSTADTIVDAAFIDESNIAVLTNKLLFVTDDSTVMDWMSSFLIDLQQSCTSDSMNCQFEVVDRNVMSYHINAEHQYQMDLMDSFNYYHAPIEYGNGKLLNTYMGIRSFLFNDSNMLTVQTVSATENSAVIRTGRTLFELWHDPNIDAFVKTGESFLTPVNDLHFNPVGLYYCADAYNKLSCSGFLQSANRPLNGEPNTYMSGQPIHQFQFADYDRDLVLGLTSEDGLLYLSLFNLYGGAAYKGPQISGDIFDTEVKMDGSDDIPGIAFSFRVTDRDTRIDQLTVTVTAQDDPFDTEIKAPFYKHVPIYTASCVNNQDGDDYNCSGTIVPAYENASFKQTVTVTVSDGINVSHKSFTLFLDREAPVLNDSMQTIALATPETYQMINMTFDSSTSASATNCSGVDYCYLINDGFVDEWAFDNKPSWLSCVEQASIGYGSKLLHCTGQPPMGAAGTYQMQITAYQNRATDYEKSDNMILTLDVRAPDSVPNAFSFSTQNDVERDTLTESNTVTLYGLTGYAALSLDKGEYRRNGGAWTSAAASNIVNGDTIQLRLTSSSEYSTASTATLTVGGVSAGFTLNTKADPTVNDSTPDSFNFIALTDQALNQLVESNTITVSGISIAADVTVSNGEFKIDDGSWSSLSATINNGQTVTLRHTTSADYASDVVSSLNIGGVSAEFRSTTQALLAPVLSSDGAIAEPVMGGDFDFTPLNSGGEIASWSITNKPNWASFDSASGRLSGIVDSLDSFSIEITATNATGSDTFTATVNVQSDDAPYINGYATNCSIDDDFCDFAFTDNAGWRSAVNQITIGEQYGGGSVTVLTSPDDYELSEGRLRLKINATNNMVKQGGNWHISISSNGYVDTGADFMLDSGTPSVGTLSVSPAFAVGQVSTISAAVTNRLNVPSRYADVDVSLLVKNLTHDIDEVYKTAYTLESSWSELSSSTVSTDDSGNLSLLLKIPGCVSASDGFQLTIGTQVLEYLNSVGDCIDIDWTQRKRETFYTGGMAPVADSQGNSYRLYFTTADFEGNVHTGGDGFYDLYLVKFDRNGEQKWVKLLANGDGSLFSKVVSMQIDNDQIYITGLTTIDMDGAGSEALLGETDIFVTRLDTDGNIQWLRQFGSALSDAPYDMTIHNSKLYLISKVGFATGDSTSPDNTVLYTLDMDGTNLQTLMDSSSAVELIDNTSEPYNFMRIDAAGNIYLVHGDDVDKYDSSGTLLEVSAPLSFYIKSMVLTDHSVCVATTSKDVNNIEVERVTCMNTDDLYVRWSQQIESNAPYTHGSNSSAFLAQRDGVIYTFLSSEKEIFYDYNLADTPSYTLNLIAFNEDDGDMINHKSWPTETRTDAYAVSAGIFVNTNGNIFLNGRVIHKFEGTFQIGYIQVSQSIQYPQNSILMKTTLPAGSNSVALSGMTRSLYSQIVTDHDHALQWDDGWNASDWGNWSGADSACSSSTWGGFDDWRLPTDVELSRGGIYTPQEDTIFQYYNTQANNLYLWTSVAVDSVLHIAVRPQGPLAEGLEDSHETDYRCVRDY